MHCCMHNLINHQSDIDKIHLFAKDPYKAKYQFLVKKHEDVRIKHLNDPKAFIEYSNDMHDMCIKTLKNIIQERNAKY